MYSDHKRAWLMGILSECPAGHSLSCCPARGMRELSIDDRLQIAGRASTDVVDRILAYHQMCLQGRTGDGRPQQ